MAIVTNAKEAGLLLEHLLDRVTAGCEDVMIERPHGEPVVLLPLGDYLALTAALVAPVPDPRDDATDHDGAELYSLDALRRRRDRFRSPETERRATVR